MSAADKKSLATLIYYPRAKDNLIRQTETNMEDWYKVHLYRLIEVDKRAASKYTRSKVRKAIPPNFAYVIEELITRKRRYMIRNHIIMRLFQRLYGSEEQKILSRQFQS